MIPYETAKVSVHDEKAGWHRVKDAEVWRRGDRIVVTGRPRGEDDGVPPDHPEAHNCDAMLCPSTRAHNVIVALVDARHDPSFCGSADEL